MLCLWDRHDPLEAYLQDEYRTEPGSVIAADFYHASTLLPLSDEEIVRKVHSNIAKCEPGFRDAQVSSAGAN